MASSKINIWGYLSIICLFLFIITLFIAYFNHSLASATIFGIRLYPLLLLLFFIPFDIFYRRSNFDFHKYLFANPNRSKAITYICLILIPLSAVHIFRLLIFPEFFIKYGTIYGKEFAYTSIFIYISFIIALLGYWHLKKWSVILYILVAVASYYLININFSISEKTCTSIIHVVVISIGYYDILKNKSLS